MVFGKENVKLHVTLIALAPVLNCFYLSSKNFWTLYYFYLRSFL